MTAWIALSLWPFVAMAFFRSTSPPVALCLTIIGGYLLLPPAVGLDLPLLPSFNKYTIPALSALALTVIVVRTPTALANVQPGWLPQSPVLRAFIVCMFAGIFITVLTNRAPFSAGPVTIPGHRIYDAFSFGLSAMMHLIPFLLGRKLLASEEGQRALVNVMIGAAACYAFLALWEIRMSPQLNLQLYGFFPHGWSQHVRGGGFRPIVFLSHGLWLGIFFASAIIAAFAMTRATVGNARALYYAVGVWLLGTLFLSKTLGAFLIVLIFVPVALILPRRVQVMVATSVVVLVLLYPLLRHVDVVPTDSVVSFAERIDSDRARSLQYRLDNEDALLDRARERPLFGWGSWGRSRIYDEAGRDISVTDGRWVILFGEGGWVRYICDFGLLTWGIVALLLRRREILTPVCIAILLALTVNLIDLLPNAGISPLTWLMAGALAGRLERTTEPVSELAPEPVGTRQTVYRRTFDTPGRVPQPPGPAETVPETRHDPASGRYARQNLSRRVKRGT